MDNKQDWKRLHDEHYSRGVSIEERIGFTLLILVPIAFLIAVAVEVWRYHSGQ